MRLSTRRAPSPPVSPRPETSARLAPVCLALAIACSLARAQEPPPLPVQGPPVVRETVAPGSVEAELRELEARLKEIEASGELAKELRDQLVERYKFAIARLQQAIELATRAAEYRQQLTDAPAKSRAIRERLAEAARQPPPPATVEVTDATTSRQLEQDLARLQADVQAARGRLTALEAKIEEQRKRPAQAREQLAEARQKIEEIGQEQGKPVDETQPRELTAAQQAVLRARRRARLAEVEAVEQELLSADARLELLMAERDDAAREVGLLSARAQATQEAANRRRLEEAEQERRRAEAAQVRARGEHPVVRGLADQIVEAGKRLEEIGRKITQTTKRADEIKAQRAQIEKDFSTARQRLDKAGLSDVVGRILRRQRLELPDPREYERETEKRESQISLVELSLIDVEEQAKKLASADEEIARRMVSVEQTIQGQERIRIEEQVRELVASKRDLISKLEESFRSYLVKLGELDMEQKLLIASSEAYAAFLDERLLWIRSSDPINLRTAGDLMRAIGWIGNPVHWLDTAERTLAVVPRAPGATTLMLLLLAVVLLARRKLRLRVQANRPRVGKVQTDSFALTVEAFVSDVVRVLPAPLVIWFFASHVRADPLASEFPKAIAAGAMSAAFLIFALHFLWRVVKREGLAQLHFRWRPRALEVVRSKTLWLTGWAIVLPSAFLVAVMIGQGDESHRDSLGRLALITLMASIGLIVARLLGPSRGVLAERIQLEPNGWLAKLRVIWYPLAVGLPFALAVLAAVGYNYTAIELGGDRLQGTIVLALIAVLLHNVVQRWLWVAHRRMAWDKAMEERRARLAAASAAASGEQPAPAEGDKSAFEVTEPDVDLKQINEQARHLVGTLIGASVIIGLWAIWSSVLPALRVLDEARLWDYTVITAEGTTTEWITLRHIAMATIVALITAVASRNIPGALELTILQRLPIEPGGRYAITTVCQYIIVAIGVVLAFQAIGVGWSHVQWLVAAVGVGLGFGLQEIFANFVSGMILLLERPIRVGDIVTIGDVTGVVTRIKMRATTVRNWDRKELVVPNKEFITGRLLNWTLSDAINRVVIEVGVAYGSDTERAKEVLLKVASDHPLIMKDPPPVATFEFFGDSFLKLVLRCFLPDLKNRLPVIHELHTAIDRAFREAKIEIAFPQRDLHLRASDGSVRIITRDEPSWTVGGGEHGGPVPTR